MDENNLHPRNSKKAAWFTTTHWSVVLRARDQDSPEARDAMEQLCRTYWPSLYGYLRKKGYREEDAQDLTQEFFSRFLEKGWLSHLKHRNGKFRSFLLTFLEHFLSDEYDRTNALKRGGGLKFLSFEELQAEEHDSDGFTGGLTPEQVFERRWAKAVLDQAAARLREEYIAKGQAEFYEYVKELQPGERGQVTYEELAKQLGMTESGIKSAVHRMRERRDELLREIIADTLTDPAEVDEEIRHLLKVLSS